MHLNPLKSFRRDRPHRPSAATLAAIVLAAATLTPAFTQAQSAYAAPASLPDAPLPAASSSVAGLSGDASAPSTAVPVLASSTDKYIAPGQPVPAIGVRDKVLLGFKDAFSPLAFLGWAASAGYEQALNGSPNYGNNSIAFGKRFGASAARASSEGVFSDSIMASVLREDPRYYRMGPRHNPGTRALYAVSRTFITRTDSGRSTINLALLSGNLGGAFLTKTYYPDLNTSTTEVLKTFGGSLGGNALGFAISEFLSGALNIVHGSHPVPD